mmetsp:Transcript_7505/g.15288  ORF Transcript_7505/g.15288 Transcript_7505/m.15288 type:complete len:235 (+) Transcript_7505:271-975(+)
MTLLIKLGEQTPTASAPPYATANSPRQMLNTRSTPSRTLSVRTSAMVSPLTSGMSLKSAITTEHRHMNAVANTTGPVSTGAAPSTTTDWWRKKPSCTSTARTTKMHAAARKGKRFHRRNGSSTEYTTPSARLSASVICRGREPLRMPSSMAAMADTATICSPICGVSAPLASGRYGLFTLSISMSYSWFSPTMAMFISSAGISACITPASITGLRSALVRTASREMDTTLTAVP